MGFRIVKAAKKVTKAANVVPKTANGVTKSATWVLKSILRYGKPRLRGSAMSTSQFEINPFVPIETISSRNREKESSALLLSLLSFIKPSWLTSESLILRLAD